ncbi:MAG: protein kinase, partial [Planctomycetota bacterium]
MHCDPIDEVIREFEQDWSAASIDQVQATLGRHHLLDDPLAITELVRIDIEKRCESDLAYDLSDYFCRFPTLLDDPDRVGEMAYEDFRCRAANGWSVPASRWQQLPRIERQTWFRALVEEELLQVGHRLGATTGDASVAPELVSQLSDIGFDAISTIGRGSFSVVVLARQSDLAQRGVVLKVVRQTFSEPESLATLQHTNIVPIYSVHRIPDRSVLCMPYAGQLTLAEFLRERPESTDRSGDGLASTVRHGSRSASSDHIQDDVELDAIATSTADSTNTEAESSDDHLGPLDEIEGLRCEQLALWMFSRLSAGLAHSHAGGILHGDLKPANVLIRSDGEPALLDFNLARTTGQSSVNRFGGTLGYMPPETQRALLSAAPPEAMIESDIYSLGVMLYQFVTSRLPFEPPLSMAPEDVRSALERREKQSRVRWFAQDQASRGLKRIIERCLELEPSARYRSARQLRDDLDCQAQQQSLRHTTEPLSDRITKSIRRSPAWYSAAAITLALTGLLGFAVSKSIQASKQASVELQQRTKAEAEARLKESQLAFNRFEEASSKVLAALTLDPVRGDRSRIESTLNLIEGIDVLSKVDQRFLLDTPGLTSEERAHRKTVLYRHIGQLFYAEAKYLEARYERGSVPREKLALIEQLSDAAEAYAPATDCRSIGFIEAMRTRLHGDLEHASGMMAAARKIKACSSLELYFDVLRNLGTKQVIAANRKLDERGDDGSVPAGALWTSRALAQFANHRYDVAERSFTHALDKLSDSSQLYFFRGLCYLELTEGANAYDDFLKATELDVTNAAAWGKLVKAAAYGA